MAEIRGLTVRQPWAFAIAYGGKTIENRTRNTMHRGMIAIHSGLALDEPGFYPTDTDEGLAAARAMTAAGGRSNMWNPRERVPTAMSRQPHPGLALGAVIAVADLVGCHYWHAVGEPSCSPWAIDGQWHWELSNVRPLAEPVPCRGALGLWRLDEETEKAVCSQLEAYRG